MPVLRGFNAPRRLILERDGLPLKRDDNGLPMHGLLSAAPGWQVERQLPTGEREAAAIEPGPFGSRTYDDAFLAPAGGAPFALQGDGRRIELRLDEGYSFAQIYAPADTDALAIEPMTAPTNALVTSADLPSVEPGQSFSATWSLTLNVGSSSLFDTKTEARQ